MKTEVNTDVAQLTDREPDHIRRALRRAYRQEHNGGAN